MKKVFILFKMLIVAATLSLSTACGDDAKISNSNDYTFDFKISDLVGIWETTAILDSSSGEWYAVDGSVAGYSVFSFKLRFNSDYSYLLDGVVSNESGTYSTYGSIITTYVSGVQQAEYDILELDSSSMKLMRVIGTDVSTYTLSKSW